jgi:hypothetical protein
MLDVWATDENSPVAESGRPGVGVLQELLVDIKDELDRGETPQDGVIFDFRPGGIELPSGMYRVFVTRLTKERDDGMLEITVTTRGPKKKGE